MRAHSHEARNACLLGPQKQAPRRARLWDFAHKIQCDELKPVWPGTGDHE